PEEEEPVDVDDLDPTPLSNRTEDEPEPDRPRQDATDDPQPTPEPDTDSPAAGPDTPDPGSDVLSVQLPSENSREILRRLFREFDDTAPPSRLRALRDTTFAVWERGAMPLADSALTAYVMGSVLIPLGDSIQGVEWLEEAVRLDPRGPYVELLELHRGGG
ncbi:MAG: hypothetical protein ACOCUZ_02270, partial [bacterium]